MDNQLLTKDQFSFLFGPHPATTDFLSVFLVLFLISIPVAYLLSYYVPARFKQSNRKLMLLFISINTFVPIVGFVLTVIGLYAIKYYSPTFSDIDIATTDQKDLGTEKVAKISAYGAGWARIRLTDSKFSKQERAKALYAINKKINRQVNDINRVLFSDDSDEIRMYAFNIINLQQSKIANSIHHCLEMLDKAHDATEFAELHKLLATLYWELINLNLTPGQLATDILDKALFHAESALDILSQDGNLWLLLAKIYKALNQEDKYRRTIEAINQLSNPPNEIYLHLAEINFEEHHYKMIRYYLSKDLLKYNLFASSSIIEFWSKNAN